VVVVFLVVFVGHCVGRNRHPGNNCQAEHYEHQFAELHRLLPLKPCTVRSPADAILIGYYSIFMVAQQN